MRHAHVLPSLLATYSSGVIGAFSALGAPGVPLTCAVSVRMAVTMLNALLVAGARAFLRLVMSYTGSACPVIRPTHVSSPSTEVLPVEVPSDGCAGSAGDGTSASASSPLSARIMGRMLGSMFVTGAFLALLCTGSVNPVLCRRMHLGTHARRLMCTLTSLALRDSAARALAARNAGQVFNRAACYGFGSCLRGLIDRSPHTRRRQRSSTLPRTAP